MLKPRAAVTVPSRRLPLFCLSSEAQSNLGHTEESLYHRAAFSASKRVIDAVAMWGSTYLLRHVLWARRNSVIYCIMMFFVCCVSVLCWGLTQHDYIPTASRAESTGEKKEYPCQNMVGGFTPCGDTPSIPQGQAGIGNDIHEHRRSGNPEGSVMPWVERARSVHCY